MIFANK